MGIEPHLRLLLLHRLRPPGQSGVGMWYWAGRVSDTHGHLASLSTALISPTFFSRVCPFICLSVLFPSQVQTPDKSVSPLFLSLFSFLSAPWVVAPPCPGYPPPSSPFPTYPPIQQGPLPHPLTLPLSHLSPKPMHIRSWEGLPLVLTQNQRF